MHGGRHGHGRVRRVGADAGAGHRSGHGAAVWRGAGARRGQALRAGRACESEQHGAGQGTGQHGAHRAARCRPRVAGSGHRRDRVIGRVWADHEDLVSTNRKGVALPPAADQARPVTGPRGLRGRAGVGAADAGVAAGSSGERRPRRWGGRGGQEGNERHGPSRRGRARRRPDGRHGSGADEPVSRERAAVQDGQTARALGVVAQVGVSDRRRNSGASRRVMCAGHCPSRFDRLTRHGVDGVQRRPDGPGVRRRRGRRGVMGQADRSEGVNGQQQGGPQEPSELPASSPSAHRSAV